MISKDNNKDHSWNNYSWWFRSDIITDHMEKKSNICIQSWIEVSWTLKVLTSVKSDQRFVQLIIWLLTDPFYSFDLNFISEINDVYWISVRIVLVDLHVTACWRCRGYPTLRVASSLSLKRHWLLTQYQSYAKVRPLSVFYCTQDLE